MTRASARPFLWVVLLLCVAVVVLAVWALLAARTVASEAAAVEQQLRRLESALGLGENGLPEPNTNRARDAVSAANAHARSADAAAHVLPLRVAAHLPGVGDDVAAVQDVTVAVHVLTAEALPMLLEVADSLRPEALAAPEGGIDVARLEAVAPAAEAAAEAAASARAQVETIEPDQLLPAVADPVREARDQIVQLAEVSRLLSQGLDVLPSALGAQEPRHYLLAFQNLAEARPTGGIIGAWALLEVDRGRLGLAETGVNDDLEDLSGPVRDLGPEVRHLYGPDLALSQNVNLSPHFPHAATLMSDLWQAQGRAAPDGVISLDPVALAALLDATGEVTVPGGPDVDADSVVDVVQADAYAQFTEDRRERLVYLTALTAAVFAAVVEEGLGSPELIGGAVEAAADGHIQVWAADERLQQLAERAAVAGALPAPGPDQIRVHLTNVDASKLDHYLSVDVECSEQAVIVGLTSSVPEEVPEYVANSLPGADPTSHLLVVDLFIPPNRGIESTEVGGEAVGISSRPLMGWTVVRTTVEVPRGERIEVSWSLLGTGGRPSAVVQPLTTPAVTDKCA